MKIFLKLTAILLVVFLIAGAIYINSNNYNNLLNQPDPEDLIIGVWNGVKPADIQWKFTDVKLIKNNDLEYSYS